MLKQHQEPDTSSSEPPSSSNILPQIFNFSIAADWTYDTDFIQLLVQAAEQDEGLTTYVVWPNNLNETLQRLQLGEFEFNFFFDRASNTSPEFLKLHYLLLQNNVPVLDSIEKLNRAADKATMHLEFIANGLIAPYTIIIPPFNTTENIFLSVADLAQLGRPFIIKPANTTGGGIGVVDGAETLQDVLKTRKEYHNDKYLLQEKVIPLEKDGKRFWFRGFYCCGLVECCWWHDITHVYELLTPEQVESYQLTPLFSTVRKIADISKLQFFSTEIAVNQKKEFVVIDYVNEICDMRLKSYHFDGVPDEVVNKITSRIAAYAKEQISSKGNPY